MSTLALEDNVGPHNAVQIMLNITDKQQNTHTDAAEDAARANGNAVVAEKPAKLEWKEAGPAGNRKRALAAGEYKIERSFDPKSEKFAGHAIMRGEHCLGVAATEEEAKAVAEREHAKTNGDTIVAPEATAPGNTAAVLAEHAEHIRELGRRMFGDVVEIGRRLAECKRLVGHGNFGDWLDRQFGWSERTAQRFMSVYELSAKNDKLSDLELPMSAVYLLAAPSTPPEAVERVLDKAGEGERVSVKDVKDIVDQFTVKPQPAGEPAPAGEPKPLSPEEVEQRRREGREEMRGYENRHAARRVVDGFLDPNLDDDKTYDLATVARALVVLAGRDRARAIAEKILQLPEEEAAGTVADGIWDVLVDGTQIASIGVDIYRLSPGHEGWGVTRAAGCQTVALGRAANAEAARTMAEKDGAARVARAKEQAAKARKGAAPAAKAKTKAKRKIAKSVTRKVTIADAVSGGWGVLEELAGEMREAFDNTPESLQQSPVGQAREEAADALENLSEPSVPDSLGGREFE